MAHEPTPDLAIQLSSLKETLHDCIQRHQGMCDRQRNTLLPATTNSSQSIYQPHEYRVIDVKELKVVPAPPNCRYLALSYVWERRRVDEEGNESTEPTSKSPSDLIILSRLPKTIANAIAVCWAMEERYLWVDALCIIQTDPGDVAHQVGQMDRIYSFATATIVAAIDKSPEEGLPCLRQPRSDSMSSPPKDAIAKSLWSTRGWTYQEFVLSRRLLLFTCHGIYFHCAKAPWTWERCQSLRGWELPSVGDLGGDSCWEAYNRSLQIYTGRQLGRKSDTLNAFAGIQRVFSRYTDDSFLCGLPARQIFYALLWQPLAVAERQPSWPSWSWFGWAGAGHDLCAVNNPAHWAVRRQWFGGSGRVFYSNFSQLRFQGRDGTELNIDLLPDDDSLQQYLSERKPMELPCLAPDKPFHETGYLRFSAEKAFFSISLDQDHLHLSKTNPLLRSGRILQDDTWIGTIFLNPDCSGTYPDTSGPCEFIILTEFRAYVQYFATDYLDGLLDMQVERTEPAIFPAYHYEIANTQFRRQCALWEAGIYHCGVGYLHPTRTRFDQD